MMTINSGNRDANQTQTLHYNMNTQNDPLSKNIQEQIANAQKQMQEISADTELTPEQKMKKRQEIQQQIANLNQQLRQRQIEQRKEQQAKAAAAREENSNRQKTETEKQNAPGISQTGMETLLSADSTLKQAKIQGNTATRMEGRANVLKIEIKQDKGDTSAKEAELAKMEQKAEDATNAQLNTLVEVNQTLTDAAETGRREDQADNASETNNKDNRLSDQTNRSDSEGRLTGVTDSEDRQIAKVSVGPDDNAQGTALHSMETTDTASGIAAERTDTNTKPAPKKHINIVL